MTPEEIGHLAIAMNKAYRVVKRWMAYEATRGNLVTAGQAPGWKAYEETSMALNDALDTVPD